MVFVVVKMRKKIWIVHAFWCATGRTGLNHDSLQLYWCCCGCLNIPLYSIATSLPYSRPHPHSLCIYTLLCIYLRIRYFLYYDDICIWILLEKKSECYNMKTSMIIARLNQRIHSLSVWLLVCVWHNDAVRIIKKLSHSWRKTNK